MNNNYLNNNSNYESQNNNFQGSDLNNQNNNQQNVGYNNLNNNQFGNYQNMNLKNQNETNVSQLNNYSNMPNNEKKKTNYVPIIVILGVIIAIFFGSKLLGNNNNSDMGTANGGIQNTNNNKEKSTPSGTTIQLGETIKIREKNTNFDLKIDSFEPKVEITYDSGITNTYAFLIGRVTNKSNEDSVNLYNINIFDSNNIKIASCTPNNSKDSQSKLLGSIEPGQTKDVYFSCYLTSSSKNSVAVKAVYTETLISYDYVNGELKEIKEELEYYIDLD